MFAKPYDFEDSCSLDVVDRWKRARAYVENTASDLMYSLATSSVALYPFARVLSRSMFLQNQGASISSPSYDDVSWT